MTLINSEIYVDELKVCPTGILDIVSFHKFFFLSCRLCIFRYWQCKQQIIPSFPPKSFDHTCILFLSFVYLNSNTWLINFNYMHILQIYPFQWIFWLFPFFLLLQTMLQEAFLLIPPFADREFLQSVFQYSGTAGLKIKHIFTFVCYCFLS